MQLELSDRAAEEITKRATASGVEVKKYVDNLLFGGETPLPKKKPFTAEELGEMLRKEGATLGRNGRHWREFIHEGHKY